MSGVGSGLDLVVREKDLVNQADKQKLATFYRFQEVPACDVPAIQLMSWADKASPLSDSLLGLKAVGG